VPTKWAGNRASPQKNSIWIFPCDVSHLIRIMDGVTVQVRLLLLVIAVVDLGQSVAIAFRLLVAPIDRREKVR
jgi:hypothetical protein